MTSLAADARKITQRNVERAMAHNAATTREGLRERMFAFLFSGLVYPQIWEDPLVDAEALALGPDDHVVAIASGGCNVMSYLLSGPARITALDLNASHVALLKLKLAAARVLDDHTTFFRFFGSADVRANLDVYGAHLRAHLDDSTRRHWDGRTVAGRRRVSLFARGLYRRGLLGRFIGLGHVIARLHGKDPRRMLEARTPAEQRAIYERELKPVIRSPLVRWLTANPASLYGLGIPPSQYRALLSVAREGEGMDAVLAERLERLATGFALDDNYFAWQAFGRGYSGRPDASLPPYLQPANYSLLRERVERVDVRQENFIDHLKSCPDASRDAFVLLDAQDWMNDEVLNALWREIDRVARPGARVIFRTAARENLLPGRLDPDLLARWSYDEARCRAWTERDRSAIYGGFHLHTRAAS